MLDTEQKLLTYIEENGSSTWMDLLNDVRPDCDEDFSTLDAILKHCLNPRNWIEKTSLTDDPLFCTIRLTTEGRRALAAAKREAAEQEEQRTLERAECDKQIEHQQKQYTQTLALLTSQIEELRKISSALEKRASSAERQALAAEEQARTAERQAQAAEKQAALAEEKAKAAEKEAQIAKKEAKYSKIASFGSGVIAVFTLILQMIQTSSSLSQLFDLFIQSLGIFVT